MASIRYIDDAGLLQTRAIDVEEFVLGRAATCQLSLVDDTISREHLRIDRDGTRFRIRDLGSRNKTFVNGELITETHLSPGDIIRAGGRVLEFLDDGAIRESIDLDFITPDASEPPDCQWIRMKTPLSLTAAQIEKLALLADDPALTARAEDIAEGALGRLILDVQAERGFAALRGEGKLVLHPLAHRALKRPTAGSLVPVSQTFLHAPILQHVSGRYPESAGELNPKLGYAIAAMAAPMVCRGEIIGVLYLDRPTAKKAFGPSDLQYLTAAAAYLGAMLGESSRRLVRAAARESATWMTTLRRMQSSLAPAPVRGEAFDVALRCHPGRCRGGDFADVIHIDEQRCAILVVDGGGHGILGIAQGAAIRAAVRASLAVSPDLLLDPTSIFAGINATLFASPTRKSIPCLYVGIDLAAGRLAYINAAGAPPLLMLAPARLVTLDQGSLLLGVDPDHAYHPTHADIPSAFRVVCHTHGLTEAANAAGEPLGDQRLHDALLEREAFTDPSGILARLDHLWTTHLSGTPADDDALILVVGRG